MRFHSTACQYQMRALAVVALLAASASACVHTGDELQYRIDRQWNSSDDHRVEFVYWVNAEQPFNGLAQPQVRQLLGPPTSIHENQEYPYNGLSGEFEDELLKEKTGVVERPAAWVYQTLRKGSKESLEWGGEGSGYLLDLIIQFNARGEVYGAGTNQFTTGGDYYELLNSKPK